MPIITEKAQEPIDVFSIHCFGMLIVVKPDESLYPMDVGFLCLVGITLVAKIYPNPVNKAF